MQVVYFASLGTVVELVSVECEWKGPALGLASESAVVKTELRVLFGRQAASEQRSLPIPLLSFSFISCGSGDLYRLIINTCIRYVWKLRFKMSETVPLESFFASYSGAAHLTKTLYPLLPLKRIQKHTEYLPSTRTFLDTRMPTSVGYNNCFVSLLLDVTLVAFQYLIK